MKMKVAIVFLWRGVMGVIASLAILGSVSANDAPQPPAFTVTNPSLNPSWKGIKQFGTAGDERGYASALDDRGNLYVTGYTSGDLDGPGPGIHVGSYDAYVMKLNRDGQVEWIRQLGSPSDDRAHYIALDHRGHVYITGHSEGDLDGSGPEIHSGEGDPFLVKLDEDGQVQWIRQFGTAADEFGFGLAVDVLGNPYVAGYTSGDMDGESSGTNAGLDDLFLATFDGAGNKRWVKQIGSPNYDTGYAVATDASGYVYVTGFSLGDLDGPGPQTNAGAWDIIALKFDGRGNLKWI
jgi:Beta-propeller repeat